MKIIDARVRLPQEFRGSAAYIAPLRQTEQYDKVLGLTDKLNGGTLEGLLAELDGQGIGDAVLHAESEGGEDATLLNEGIAKVLADYPRFKGIGAVDLGRATPSELAIQVARVERDGLVGVTIQPAFFGLDIDDRTLYPMYARAEELGLTVAIHTGINYSRLHPLRHERAELLDQVACDFPDLRLIACHAGWPYVAEFCAVARRHPTVYLEFGALAPKYVGRPGTGWDVLFGMMPNLLREQILFGSDWPMMLPSRLVEEWRATGLEDDTLRALFHDNAHRLFGFDEAGSN